MYIGNFLSPQKSILGDSKITIIKIDPSYYELKLLCSEELNQQNLTVREWSQKYKMIGAVNAGMYMKNFDFVNNKNINKEYMSVAAFNPKNKKGNPFMIFDIDEIDIEKIIEDYNTVVQNLRLLKKPAENRWSKQTRKWSEVPLGQDINGNALFIFSRKPQAMFDFNNTILSLPIDIINAQHLEGGPPASLYFSHNDFTIELNGSYETNSIQNDENDSFLTIPNVIGISRKK